MMRSPSPSSMALEGAPGCVVLLYADDRPLVSPCLLLSSLCDDGCRVLNAPVLAAITGSQSKAGLRYVAVWVQIASLSIQFHYYSRLSRVNTSVRGSSVSVSVGVQLDDEAALLSLAESSRQGKVSTLG